MNLHSSDGIGNTVPASEICPNGHIYDSNRYKDGCPYCKNTDAEPSVIGFNTERDEPDVTLPYRAPEELSDGSGKETVMESAEVGVPSAPQRKADAPVEKKSENVKQKKETEANKERKKAKKNISNKRRKTKLLIVIASIVGVIILALVIALAVSSKKSSAKYSGGPSSVGQYGDSFAERERRYSDAVDNLRKEVYDSLIVASGQPELTVHFYSVDINSDGYEDIIYQCEYIAFVPVLAVYDDGEFKTVDINSEVVAGSIFPSGYSSGYFIDKENQTVVIRYGGHTEGTSLYHGAEAFRIDGSTATSIWVLYSDSEKYSEHAPEDLETAKFECQQDFENKYLEKTQSLNLVNFFYVMDIWDVKADEDFSFSIEKVTVSEYGQSYCDKLTLEGTYPGISAINEALKNGTDSFISGKKEYEESALEFLKHDSFLEYSSEEMLGHFEYTLVVDNIWRRDNLLSIRYLSKSYEGGAHGYYMKTGRTFDLNTGKEIKLSEFSSINPEISLKELLVKYNDIYFDGRGSEYDTQKKNSAEIISTDPDSVAFFIDGDSLVLHYNQYEIASYGAGEFDIEVPLSELDI